MKDLPIIFSAPMVRALIEGRKTQTRRLARDGAPYASPWRQVEVGDRLWAREAFRVQQTDRICDAGGWYRLVCIDYPAAEGMAFDYFRRFIKVYEKDASPVLLNRRGESGKDAPLNPSIHLPRVASRLTLVVTATKIERLQDITPADAMAEGVERRADRDYQIGPDIQATDPVGCYSALWWSLHGIGAWNENPEVVALTFTVHKLNIDAMPKTEAA